LSSNYYLLWLTIWSSDYVLLNTSTANYRHTTIAHVNGDSLLTRSCILLWLLLNTLMDNLSVRSSNIKSNRLLIYIYPRLCWACLLLRLALRSCLSLCLNRFSWRLLLWFVALIDSCVTESTRYQIFHTHLSTAITTRWHGYRCTTIWWDNEQLSVRSFL